MGASTRIFEGAFMCDSTSEGKYVTLDESLEPVIIIYDYSKTHGFQLRRRTLLQSRGSKPC